jgi:hypothetical protein
MRQRRDIKKAWFVMQLMLSAGGINEKEKQAITKTKLKFDKKLNEIDTSKEANEVVSARRRYLQSNPDLETIFQMFWRVMQIFRDPVTDIITEDGYIKFNIFVQKAVIGGQMNEIEAINVAKTDYVTDTACYGPLRQECFFDILLELIEMWAENGVPKLLTSFAWALLNRFLPSHQLTYSPSLSPQYL